MGLALGALDGLGLGFGVILFKAAPPVARAEAVQHAGPAH